MVAMFVDGSGQNEQSLERTFHRCFLPSFTSFGWGVLEKIKMWKVNGRQTPSDGKSSRCLWQGELKKHNKSLASTKFTSDISIQVVVCFVDIGWYVYYLKKVINIDLDIKVTVCNS